MTERHCLRCGAPYEEGATVCFTCGASIGELETPTQPVRAPKKVAAPTEPSAPIPADAPVATATEAPAGVAPADADSAAPPSRPLTVGTSYRPVVVAPSVRPPQRSRWPLLAVALVVIAALATGGYYAARVFLAPPPVPTTLTYHDPSGRFSFAEPALWKVTPTSNGAQLTDSTGASTLTLTVGAAPAGQTASAAANAIIGSYSGAPSSAIASIGGDQWQQLSVTFTGPDGATRVLQVYADVHAGQLYLIETSSPTSVASSTNALVYQPLLASFTFH